VKSGKPYLEQTIVTYNPHYGDDRVCECGHRYYRHFDSYENNDPCGCKYCTCRTFKEAKLHATYLSLEKSDIERSDNSFLGVVRLDGVNGEEAIGVLFPIEYVRELRHDMGRLVHLLAASDADDLKHLLPLFENFANICDEIKEIV
jgi:hypothetical protein